MDGHARSIVGSVEHWGWPPVGTSGPVSKGIMRDERSLDGRYHTDYRSRHLCKGGYDGTLSQTGAGEWAPNGLTGGFAAAGTRSDQESNDCYAGRLFSMADGI